MTSSFCTNDGTLQYIKMSFRSSPLVSKTIFHLFCFLFLSQNVPGAITPSSTICINFISFVQFLHLCRTLHRGTWCPSSPHCKCCPRQNQYGAEVAESHCTPRYPHMQLVNSITRPVVFQFTSCFWELLTTLKSVYHLMYLLCISDMHL